jgi:hypothetical protein
MTEEERRFSESAARNKHWKRRGPFLPAAKLMQQSGVYREHNKPERAATTQAEDAQNTVELRVGTMGFPKTMR